MPKEENLNQEIDLKKYDNSDSPSLKELNFGLWLSEKRKKIRQLFIIGLIVISGGLFIYSIYNYFIYFTSPDINKQSVVEGTIQSPKNLVNDLEISPLNIFSNSKNSDLAVKLRNSNDKFMANFTYCFTETGENLICGNGSIMPSEEKYVLALEQNITTGSGNINFVISNISWQRIDAHSIPNWSDYANDHLNYLVNNLEFNSAQSNNLVNRNNLNTLSFFIENQSAYSYYQLPLNLLFFNGDNLVGVNRYFLQNFLGGEKRNIKISWAGNLPTVNQTKVQADINLMDKNVYLQYQGDID